MMLGIGLGIMTILCALGFVVGGGLFMHQGSKDRDDQPGMERSHDQGKTAELSPGSLLEEQKDGTTLWTPAEKAEGEETNP